MSADENGRSYRRLTDTAGRTGQGQPASPRERRRSGRRPATSGRHRAHRLRAVPTERAVTTDAPSPTRWVAPEAVWVADSAARSVEVGSMLGNRYRLERVLGAGGSATVFRGTDTVLDRPVAVKVFRGATDVTAHARWEREINLASGFVHPNLVAVYDAHLPSAPNLDDPEGALSYLVCEYVDGQALAHRLDGTPLPAHEVTQIGIGAAQALTVLHTAGVVHRDVKPGNVLLENPTGRVALGDFGIARDLGTDPVTRTHDVIGTAPYLSPEQALGERVGCPSDIYSLGLVLLECLTGRREYDGAPIPAAIARLVRDPVIPPDLPRPWPTLLDRMTSRDADERPTAEEVAVILSHRSPATAAFVGTGVPMRDNRSFHGADEALVSTWAHHRRRGWMLAAAAGSV